MCKRALDLIYCEFYMLVRPHRVRYLEKAELLQLLVVLSRFATRWANQFFYLAAHFPRFFSTLGFQPLGRQNMRSFRPGTTSVLAENLTYCLTHFYNCIRV